MKTYEQWKTEHGITQGYPDHEMVYNGGWLEGYAEGRAELRKVVEALKHVLADAQTPLAKASSGGAAFCDFDFACAQIEERLLRVLAELEDE